MNRGEQLINDYRNREIQASELEDFVAFVKNYASVTGNSLNHYGVLLSSKETGRDYLLEKSLFVDEGLMVREPNLTASSSEPVTPEEFIEKFDIKAVVDLYYIEPSIYPHPSRNVYLDEVKTAFFAQKEYMENHDYIPIQGTDIQGVKAITFNLASITLKPDTDVCVKRFGFFPRENECVQFSFELDTKDIHRTNRGTSDTAYSFKELFTENELSLFTELAQNDMQKALFSKHEGLVSVDYDELITTLQCNYSPSQITPEVVIKQMKEILSIQMEDAMFSIKQNMPSILAECGVQELDYTSKALRGLDYSSKAFEKYEKQVVLDLEKHEKQAKESKTEKKSHSHEDTKKKERNSSFKYVGKDDMQKDSHKHGMER